MLPITNHAQARLQQRGIPVYVVESLLDFGCETHDHRGGTKIFFDHKALNRLRQTSSVSYRNLERYLNTYVVLGSDGTLITAAHRTRRINRDH
jgi:hypothetical protein